jgi:beta-galactosidase
MSLSHIRPTPFREFLYGSAYYPEHWDEATRVADPALYRAAGWNVIRMAEFAWDILEPSEGVFDFSLFDATIARFAAVGIRTILCTPTATPPRWLTTRYPEVLRSDADNNPMQHGSRQHASHFSPIFRAHSRRITQAMAAHYANNPHVIGWQTDNEFHCHFALDHSPAAQVGFAAWLRARYRDDITALNQAWGTAFWAQTYTRFEDVPTPRDDRPTYVNPAHALDYLHCVSDTVVEFQRDQLTLLRAAQPRWFMTHNGCHQVTDYRGQFTRDLDFLSFDSYPFFDYDSANRAANHAFTLDLVRAYSGHFVVMEQQAGAGGQGNYFHDNPEPGELRRLAWASIARGGDGLLLFRERSCRFGAEEYWVGVLDHDNVPRRRYREAAALGAELARVGSELLGSSVRLTIGIAGADFTAQHGHLPLSHGLPTPKNMAEAVHGVFYRAGHAVGVVHPSDTLAGLRLYIIPHLALFDPTWVPALEKFVSDGGTLVVGARTACKDRHNNVVPDTLPGVLRALVGATVEEYGRQNRPDRRPLALRIQDTDTDVPTTLWYEQLAPDAGTGTEVVATWTTRHLAGTPAITRRRHGRGQVLYVGTYLTREFTEAALMPLLTRLDALPTPLSNLAGLEIIERVHPDGRVLRVCINQSESELIVPIPAPFTRDLLSGRTGLAGGTFPLAPNGVAILAA